MEESPCLVRRAVSGRTTRYLFYLTSAVYMSIQSQFRLHLSSREIRMIKEKSFSMKVERQLNHLTDAELPDTATKAPFQRLSDAKSRNSENFIKDYSNQSYCR